MRSGYLVRETLRDISEILNPHIPRASREAQLLLMHHLQKDELWLISNQQTEVSNLDALYKMVYRRAKNEPLEYITNSVSFYSQEFFIDKGALIPRPETELLIDEVIKHYPDL
ncbi:MAG: peptide chain release factor N(5)-glutamine methyltransferase, partial [Sulfurimonas sp.]|nr:peptide chain release factor N(5)-glutamine methyltransferase [Sulfurimonas sp.]